MNYLDFKVTQVESIEKRNTAIVKTFDRFLTDNIDKHKTTIEKIWQTTDKMVIDSLKKTLPACQFCVSNGRGVNGIIKHSDIIQIDIDAKDNPTIKDLKAVVMQIPYVFFSMHSASGRGIFALIKILNISEYKSHFEAFKIFVKAKHQITIDNAVSSPASLRYWSYDENPKFNANAEIWRFIPKPISQKKTINIVKKFGTEASPFDIYNKYADVESLLASHGWTYQPSYNRGTRKRYSRPGKSKGVSADWCTERRILYVFSNAIETKISNASKGYNPVQVFCQLECDNDIKICASKLRALGYGH